MHPVRLLAPSAKLKQEQQPTQENTHPNNPTASTQLLKRLAGCISETVGGRTPTSSVHGSIHSEFHLYILSGSWHHLQNSNKNNKNKLTLLWKNKQREKSRLNTAVTYQILDKKKPE
ncbi:hypothetical protein TDB9533_02559 [Thalassocella blandensis]|nr:hypothetical protein TDB9533_02559 [Thalassocella blandensis]